MRRRVKIYTTLGTIVVILIIASILIPHYFGSVVYPLDYRTEIKRYADIYNLNPNFVSAVIFTESHFNPKATSNVGARGLMQIMPSTASGIARALNDKSYTVAKLYEPPRNIRYGCYYLHTISDSYKGNETLILIHYNGGPGAVGRYQRGGGLPRETQGFVYKVKSAKRMYDQIYGQWWRLAEFQKPRPKLLVPTFTNIREFWRVLIAGGGTA